MTLTRIATAIGLAIAIAGPAKAAEPQTFETPEAAVDALMTALESQSRDDILAVFGTAAEDVIFTGEAPVDREIWTEFYQAANAVSRVAVDVDGVATLFIGAEQWPMPIPIVQRDGGWIFDAAAGREEILLRRIGENELTAIRVAEVYVLAQQEYRSSDPDGDGVREFAQHFISDAGARDGLYWEAGEGEPLSPLGPQVASADAQGYVSDGRPTEPEPYHGYIYRILTAQGANAPGGAYDYVIGGNMVGGHAMLAVPAEYGVTGVMTFMVSENGTVLEADLGEETDTAAEAITAFDPDETWTPSDTGL